jgi:hypothetical protein
VTTARPTRRGERRPAGELPVARVAVDVPLAHLDRPFDYQVPEELSDDARPGVRVRVRFAGRLVDGVVLDRAARSDHVGKLGWLERVVSPEPVLSAELVALCRTVADRYAGTFADVVRLAVPPRHARVEAESARPEPVDLDAVTGEADAAVSDAVSDDAGSGAPGTGAAGSATAGFGAARSGAVELDGAEVGGAGLDAVGPGAAGLDAAGLDAVGPGAAGPGAVELDAAGPDAAGPDAPEPDASGPDAGPGEGDA